MSRKYVTMVGVCLLAIAFMGQGCPSPGGGDGGNGGGGQTTTGAQALFDQVWDDFDQNYSYFTYKNIDWDRFKTTYRPNFAANLSADEFVDRLVPMLSELRDWHVAVQRADGTWVGTETEEVQTNYTSTPRNRYTLAGYRTLGDNVIWHAWFENNIAYLRIDTLETGAWNGITDADIEDIFQTYAEAAGMIVDIRPNSGGNENNAMRIMARLIDTAVTYGYIETRNGPGHDDFDDLVEKTLTPNTGSRFNGPVVGLIGQRCMSSAEWFTLMLRAAGAQLVGDTTRGASGNPREFGPLSNGIKYMLSTWIAYAADATGGMGPEIEDQGIAPDVAIATQDSFDGEHDYVVEEAITRLLAMIDGSEDDSDDDDNDSDNEDDDDFPPDDDCFAECMADCWDDIEFCEELCLSICEDF